MHGLHLTADLSECPVDVAHMIDPQALRGICLSAVHRAGLAAVGELFHRFPDSHQGAASDPRPGGVTGVVLLAESHLAVHTWPELGAVTLDVYVCNFGADNSHRAPLVIDALIEAFAPGRVERRSLARGHASTSLPA